MAHQLIDPELAVQHGLFSRQQALKAGYTKGGVALRVRRGEWVAVSRGVLRASGRVAQDGDALLTAVLQAGPRAVASHLSAAAVLGWDLLEPGKRPYVTAPRDQRSCTSPGAHLFRRNLSADEITRVGVLPLTGPERTAIDVAAARPILESVVAIDSALRVGQVSPTGLRSALRRRRTMPGYPAAANALDLADPTSGSVPESIARLVFRSAGLPVPICQYEVTADGVWVARVDFAWPEARLVVEIDGFTWHGSAVAFQNDYERYRRLFHAGWDVLRFTADDLRTGPVAVAAEVRQALEARGFPRNTRLGQFS